MMNLLKDYMSSIWIISTPKNISYAWGFGSFLGIVMVVQIGSGFLLAWYYVGGSEGWVSVVDIMREVNGGWMIRLMHGNTASFVFIVLFVHFFRGFLMSSFYLKGPWLSGWLIMLLTMMSAFLGYVLPWGQMSFWGATVIINLISILPMGKMLVIWLWGGFYVSSFTCSFFYAFHFLVPLLVLCIAGVHLFLLHFSGSTLPGGLSRFSGLMIKFSHLFSFKDVVNMSLLWGMLIWALALPDWSADPVNFVPSDLSNSPLHIQPEWYFLHLYAVLRSIPNKLGGLIGFFMALVFLLFMSLVKSVQAIIQLKTYNLLSWGFLGTNLILLWLGMQPVEEPFIGMGQMSTFIYFLLLNFILFKDLILTKFTK